MEDSITKISDTKTIKERYLAGGCFWGIEAYAKKFTVLLKQLQDMQTEKLKIQVTKNFTVQTMQKLYI